MNFKQVERLAELYGAFYGIYAIIGPSTCYIGQTSTTFLKRWTQHIRLLRTGKHHNTRLQAAYRKDGEKALLFIIVEAKPVSAPVSQAWLDSQEKLHIAQRGVANERR